MLQHGFGTWKCVKLSMMQLKQAWLRAHAPAITPCCLPLPVAPQLALAMLLAYFVTSIVYCYETELPKPLLRPDGTEQGKGAGGAPSGEGVPEAHAGSEGKAAAGSRGANGLHLRRE